MRNGVALLLVISLFQQCSFLPNETTKKARMELVCNTLDSFDAGELIWQKVPQIEGGKEHVIKVMNPKEELEWLRYLQLSDRDFGDFSWREETVHAGHKVGKWLRKGKEDGLQSLVAQWDQGGNCKQLSARVDEKNSLFERHLNLDARFLAGDTVAILQISGIQKIIFTDPIHYHVQFIGTKP